MEFRAKPREGWINDLPAVLVRENDHTLELEMDSDDKIPEVVATALAEGGRLMSCKRYEEPLVDIFERLTAEENV